MNSLTQIEEIFAGLLNIYIVESKRVTFGDIIENELQEIALAPGYDYIKIPFTLNTGELSANSYNKKIAYSQTSIDLFLPGNDLEQIQNFAALDGKTYVLLFEDRFNNYWVAGTPTIPLRVTDSFDTGKNVSDKCGRNIKFISNSIIMFLALVESWEQPVVLADDFYLPSLEEMQLVNDNLIANSIGDFSSLQSFWTSTEFDNDDAYYISSLGDQFLNTKDSGYYVCAVRDFVSTENYNIGDAGKAGWIFYKDGNNYKEAVHLGETAIWGDNIVTGATGIAVGSGLQNTNTIIAEDPTEGIAARLAKNYVKYSE